MAENTLDDLGKMLSEPGLPCELGCAESDVEKLIPTLEGLCGAKKYRIVKHWMEWDFDVTDKELDQLTKAGFMPFMIYSPLVMFDSSDQLKRGDWVRSTPVIKVYHQSIVETANTFYLLVGTGTKKTVNLELALSIH